MCQITPALRSPPCRGRRQRAFHRLPHGVELVVAREDFDDVAAGVAEDDEVLDEIEEAAAVKHTLEHRLQFRRALGRRRIARHRPPRHEPLAVGGQRADARRNAVRDHQRRVGAEQRRDLRLVGLQLVERPIEGRVLVAGILQFDHTERQAIDEDHHVGPAVRLVLDHRVLVHRQPVVGVRIVKVDQPDLLAADGAVRAANLDRNTLDHVAMQPAVLLDQRGRYRLRQLGEHFGPRFGGQRWV